MIEDAAKALYKAAGYTDWRGMGDMYKEQYRRDARTVIRAMREIEGGPLMAAYEMAVKCGGAVSTGEIIKVWRAAVDAMLVELRTETAQEQPSPTETNVNKAGQ